MHTSLLVELVTKLNTGTIFYLLQTMLMLTRSTAVSDFAAALLDSVYRMFQGGNIGVTIVCEGLRAQ